MGLNIIEDDISSIYHMLNRLAFMVYNIFQLNFQGSRRMTRE